VCKINTGGPLKKKETKKILFAPIWGMLREIFFKLEMWPEGYRHCKFLAIQIRHHGASDNISEHVAFCLLVCGTKTQKKFFLCLFCEQLNDFRSMDIPSKDYDH